MLTNALTAKAKAELQKAMDQRMKDSTCAIASAQRCADQAIALATKCLDCVEADNLQGSEDSWAIHLLATARFNKMLDTYEAGNAEAFCDHTDGFLDHMYDMRSPMVHEELPSVIRTSLDRLRGHIDRAQDAADNLQAALDNLDEAINSQY